MAQLVCLPASRAYLFLLADVVCFAVMMGVDVALFKSVDPSKRGFFCDDQSIKYPRVEKETISTPVQAVIAIVLPTFVLALCETGRHIIEDKIAKDVQKKYALKKAPRSLQSWFKRTSCLIFTFIFGASLTWLMTACCKLMVGRLRPYFLAVCQPDWTLVNCTQGYIMEDVCTGNPQLIREARQSFPSAHSSLSMYSLLFLAIYLQTLETSKHSKLLKPFLQGVFMTIALFSGLSRIMDYMHHWSDVLAGFVLGAVVAVFFAFIVFRVFEEGRGIRRKRHLTVASDCSFEVDCV